MKRILSALAVLLPFLAACQDIIKGKVLNEGGEPVAGATIALKNTDRRVVTDHRGLFTLWPAAASDTLVVSAVGYQTAAVPTGGRTTITVTLERDARSLEGVVVSTGYQTLPRERATGSFEKVDSSGLQRVVSSSILERLEGSSTLLFDKHPLRTPLTVRGLSSINGPKAPLVVVDNFPYEGDIESINPADVQSVTVLKDAAAASIWGTRAGNGVIVITTKKGTFHQPLHLQFHTAVTAEEAPDLHRLPLLDAAGYMEVERLLFSKGYRFADTASVYRPSFSPVYEVLFRRRSGRLTDAQAEAELARLQQGDVRQQMERHLYRTGGRQQYSLQLRGGAATAHYHLSGGYDRGQSVLGASDQRVTVRSTSTFRLSRTLTTEASLSYAASSGRSGRPGYESLRPYVYPYTLLADEGGSPLPLTRHLRQPYLDTAGAGRLLDWMYYPLEDWRHQRTATSTHDLLGHWGLHYVVLPGLTLEGRYQYQRQQTGLEALQGEESYGARDLVNRFTQFNRVTGALTYIVPRGAILDRQQEVLQVHNARGGLQYGRSWGRHSLSLLGGGELRQLQTSGRSTRLYGYNEAVLTTGAVDYANTYRTFVSGAQEQIPTGQSVRQSDNRFVSLYANGSYTFRGRYTLSASARRDGSNLFGLHTNDKWQPLWSVGGSWLLSAEPFFGDRRVQQLRLRATYGYSGNTDPARSAVTTLSYVSVPAPLTGYPYANVRQYANPSLRPERVRMLNLGLDFGLWRGRLTGSLEYYRKRGEDLFGDAPVDYTTTGNNRLVINVAGMKGQGADLVLNARLVEGAVKWHTNFLCAYTTSRVTRYYLTTTRGSSHVDAGTGITAVEGYPVYSVLSYRWAGLDSAGNPVGVVDGKPTTQYSAITGNATTVHDLVYAGPSTPTVYGSLYHALSWKGLTLGASLQYKLGHYFRRESVNYGIMFAQRWGHADYYRRWQAPGDEQHTEVPALIYPNIASRDAFYAASEVLVRPAGHLRLQYVHLSYDWRPQKGRKGPFEVVTFYLQAANLGLLWTANREGIDPEWGSAPAPARTFSAGVRGSL